MRLQWLIAAIWVAMKMSGWTQTYTEINPSPPPFGFPAGTSTILAQFGSDATTKIGNTTPLVTATKSLMSYIHISGVTGGSVVTEFQEFNSLLWPYSKPLEGVLCNATLLVLGTPEPNAQADVGGYISLSTHYYCAPPDPDEAAYLAATLVHEGFHLVQTPRWNDAQASGASPTEMEVVRTWCEFVKLFNEFEAYEIEKEFWMYVEATGLLSSADSCRGLERSKEDFGTYVTQMTILYVRLKNYQQQYSNSTSSLIQSIFSQVDETSDALASIAQDISNRYTDCIDNW